MIKDFLKDKGKMITTFVVSVFILIFIVQNIIFLQKDTGPKPSDNHIRNAAIYYRHYCLNQQFGKHIPRGLPYPPVLYINSFPFFALKGISMESARLSLTIFSIIFLLSMFGIGKKMGDSFSGIAVMALAASSPHFINHSRVFFTDVPQIAFMALFLYLLIKSDSFSDRTYSILSGAALAFSFLSKWSTAFFMFVPILWLFISVLIRAKSNRERLISVGVPLTFIGTLFVYFRFVNIKPEGYEWIVWYGLTILIPLLFWGWVIYYLERKQRRERVEQTSDDKALVNFSLMNLIFFALGSPWYIWAGHSIKQKFLNDMEWQRDIPLNFELLITFMKTAFNFAPLLLIIGLLFIFIKRENILKSLIFPVGFIAAFIFMMTSGLPQFRYIFALLIFLSVIGGFWVSKTGKAKVVITTVLVALSLLSVLAWTVIPADNHYYRSLKVIADRQDPWLTDKIFCSEKPDRAQYDFTPVLNWISEGSSSNKVPLILLPYFKDEEIPIELEYLYWVGYSNNKDMGPFFIWNIKESDDQSLSLEIYRDSYGETFRNSGVKDVLILHRSSVSQEKTDKILKLVTDVIGSKPDVPVKKIDTGSNVSFTCLRYKKGLGGLILPDKPTPTVTPVFNF